jgi:alditol oxidase
MTAPAADGALRNWAGNVTFAAQRVLRPRSVDELQELVASSSRLRPLGSGHSFSRVADTDGDLLSLGDLPQRVEVAADGTSVTVSAGLRYGELAPRLNDAGLALHNLGSLPHICIAGAVATGTHGSGDSNGALATAVRALDLVLPSGEQVRVDRSTRWFPGAVVALGSVGVVTALTLEVQPTYDVVQVIHDDLPAAAMRDNLDEVLAAGDSVSIFTTWDPRGAEQVWVKQRTDGDRRPMPDGWLGSTTARAARHPVHGMPAAATTGQLGVRGPWHTRLPHFRLDHTPSAGDELQTEYLVDRSDAVAVLEAVGALHERVRPLLLVSELRSVAADDLWLSPSHDRDSLAVHFTWRPEPEAVLPVVDALEGVLAPFAARPHWGKVFGTDPGALAATYPHHDDARRLRRELDPDDVLGNEFLDTYLPR